MSEVEVAFYCCNQKGGTGNLNNNIMVVVAERMTILSHVQACHTTNFGAGAFLLISIDSFFVMYVSVHFIFLYNF